MENSVSKPPKSPSTTKASSPHNAATDLLILKSDSLAERARKMNLIKKMRSQNRESRESSREKSISRQNSVETEIEDSKAPLLQPTNEVEKVKPLESRLKSTQNDTRVEITPIKKPESVIKETGFRRSTVEDQFRNPSNETMFMQDRIKEMRNQIEELRNDKRILALKLEQNKPTKPNDDVKQKLKAAEQLCEELMTENSVMKKELCCKETELDEMHDAFHDEQSNECMKLRKELDQTNKNCRVLIFKLKKSEKKLEQMEQDKILANKVDMQNKLRQLEEELKMANERAKKFEVGKLKQVIDWLRAA